MKIGMVKAALLGSAMLAGLTAPAEAAINWADLTARTDPTTVVGTVTDGVSTVGVTYTGAINFVQTGASTDTDYWNDTYISSWNSTPPPPPTTDIISLDAGGAKSITFSSAVTDVYLAFTSWNGVTANFSRAFTVEGQGCGYWGCGSFSVAPGSTAFTGNNEVHGVLKFAGPITSLSFTDTNENWHGLQIGVGQASVASALPEPASWAMMIVGFGAIGSAARRRRRVTALA